MYILSYVLKGLHIKLVILSRGLNYDLLKSTARKTRTHARRKLPIFADNINGRGDELVNLNE